MNKLYTRVKINRTDSLIVSAVCHFLFIHYLEDNKLYYINYNYHVYLLHVYLSTKALSLF